MSAAEARKKAVERTAHYGLPIGSVYVEFYVDTKNYGRRAHELRICQRCGAVVSSESIDIHDDWHEAQA